MLTNNFGPRCSGVSASWEQTVVRSEVFGSSFRLLSAIPVILISSPLRHLCHPHPRKSPLHHHFLSSLSSSSSWARRHRGRWGRGTLGWPWTRQGGSSSQYVSHQLMKSALVRILLSSWKKISHGVSHYGQLAIGHVAYPTLFQQQKVCFQLFLKLLLKVRALFPTMASMSHSCFANVRMLHRPGYRMLFRTMRKVSRYQWHWWCIKSTLLKLKSQSKGCCWRGANPSVPGLLFCWRWCR